MQSILKSARKENHHNDNKHVSFDNNNRINITTDSTNTDNSYNLHHQEHHITIVQAMENLEKTLKEINLPLEFPNQSSIEKSMMQLFALNNANHKLLSEVLTIQYNALFPSSSYHGQNHSITATTVTNMNSSNNIDVDVATAMSGYTNDSNNATKRNLQLFNTIDETQDVIDSNDININASSLSSVMPLLSPSLIDVPTTSLTSPSTSRRQSLSKRASFISRNSVENTRSSFIQTSSLPLPPSSPAQASSTPSNHQSHNQKSGVKKSVALAVSLLIHI